MSDDVKTTSHDELLNAKREEAAKAMVFGFRKIPVVPIIEEVPLTPIPTPVLADQTSPSPRDSMAIAGDRLRAQIAMEGEQRRKQREENLKREKEAKENIHQEEENKKKEIFEREKIEREMKERDIRLEETRKRTSADLKQQVEEVKGSGDGLKTIRTLKFDQANLIKKQNLSMIGIAIKEEERSRQRQENSSLSSGKNVKFLIASLLLIILSVGLALYVNNFYYKENPVGITPDKETKSEPIIFVDSYRTLDTTGLATDDIIDKIKNEVRNPPDLRLGTIEDFVFFKKDALGSKISLSASDLFKVIGSEAPDAFLRTLSRDYIFGILSSAENAAFIIVKTESYNKGWAGLLDWDSQTLTKDLYQVLTSLKPDKELLTKQFEDLTIKNLDTRVLRDREGTIRIVYGFLDGEKTIIIAGSKQAFIEARERFNTPRPISR